MISTVVGTNSAVDVVPSHRPDISISKTRTVDVGPKSLGQGGACIKGSAVRRMNVITKTRAHGLTFLASIDSRAPKPEPAIMAKTADVGPRNLHGNWIKSIYGIFDQISVDTGSIKNIRTTKINIKKATSSFSLHFLVANISSPMAASSHWAIPRLKTKAGSVAPQSMILLSENNSLIERK